MAHTVSAYLKKQILAEYKNAVKHGYTPRWQSGIKGNDAVTQVSRLLGTSKQTVRFVLKQYEDAGVLPASGGSLGEGQGNHPAVTGNAQQVVYAPTSASPSPKDPPEEIDVNEEIRKILNGLCDPPHTTLQVAPYKGTTQELIPVFLFSDWHIGETVDPDQVFGFNKFDLTIAADRVSTLISKGINLARRNTKAQEAVVWLGGDFVSGWLHEELVATDCCTPLQAVHWATGKLHDALKYLADEFGRLTVMCSPGNHGRLGMSRKPMAKLSTATAFDWLIYAQLKNWLETDSRIAFNIPMDGDCWAEMLGFTFLFTHGHQLGVKGGDGIIGSLGPILRGAMKTSRSLESVGRQFDTLVLGHFHQSIWQPGQGVIVNGAFIGFSEYAKVMRFRAERPSQLLFFIHEEYGPVLPVDIYL